MVSVLRLAEVEPQPWRNGGGVTRELARWPIDGDFAWRLSVADVAEDGPFSVFPGVDRILVLLQGDGMTLHFSDDGSTVRLDHPLDRLGFAGERPVGAVLHGGPTQDLNLMWRRDLVSAACAVVPCGTVTDMVGEAGAGAGTVLVVVADGEVTTPTGEVLGTGDAVVADGGPVPVLTGPGTVALFFLHHRP